MTWRQCMALGSVAAAIGCMAAAAGVPGAMEMAVMGGAMFGKGYGIAEAKDEI